MKLYKTTCNNYNVDAADGYFVEFASSASDASKARTRLKKVGMLRINTDEVEVGTTRAELIVFLNKLTAHESWIPDAVTKALTG